MHVSDGNGKSNEFVYEPRHVENAFVLIHYDEVFVFRTFLTKLSHDVSLRLNRLFHIIKAQIACYCNRA